MTVAARARSTVRAVERRRFLMRLAVGCRLAGADIDVRVARTARIGRNVRVRVATGAVGELRIGEHSSIGDGVEIRLDGGSLLVGDWVEVRSGAAFMVGGRIELQGPNLLSWGAVIHCDDHVRVDRHATVTEYVTITDSTHHHVENAWHLDHITTSPIRIGADTWVGAKSTITAGVVVGERCVIGAGAVVTRDVPDDHVAVGVPAVSRPR